MAGAIGTETGAILSGPGQTPRLGFGLSGVRAVLLPVALAVATLAAWQAFVVIGNIPSVILPSPISTLRYIVEHWDILLTHAVPTTLESAIGFVLATLLGVLLAIVITYSTLAREALYPEPRLLPADPEDRARAALHHLAWNRHAVARRLRGLHRVLSRGDRDECGVRERRSRHAAAMPVAHRERVAGLHPCPLSGRPAAHLQRDEGRDHPRDHWGDHRRVHHCAGRLGYLIIFATARGPIPRCRWPRSSSFASAGCCCTGWLRSVRSPPTGCSRRTLREG